MFGSQSEKPSSGCKICGGEAKNDMCSECLTDVLAGRESVIAQKKKNNVIKLFEDLLGGQL